MGTAKDPIYCIFTATMAASTVGAVNSNKYPTFCIKEPSRKYCISFCSREPSPFNSRNNAIPIMPILKTPSPKNTILIILHHHNKLYLTGP